MGRRGVLSNMPKMVLPTVSWVAVMRLLKKAPKNLPALVPAMGAEMAMSALLGCRASPQTDSFHYTDDRFVKGRRDGSRRPKPTAMLRGCSSRPHTDSFRVHHVVNQEALQLMLTFGDDDADLDHDAFFESEELNCNGIIRDGDRLLHDDIFEFDDSARASSSMRTCSSSLSTATNRSLTGSSCAALSRRSVDSEGLYSTANSASFSHTRRTPELLNGAGPHISCDWRPSSSIISSCDASEIVYSDVNLEHNLKLEEGEEAEVEEEELGEHDAAQDTYLDIYALQDQIYPRSITAIYNDIGVVHTIASSAGDEVYEDAAGFRENYEGDADDEEEEEEEEEIMAEMRYSEDPLEDFAEAISRMVVSQQLNKAAELQELYWRFLRLNSPSHHHTITLAFLHALQRLASFEPHFLHTLL